MKVVHLTLHRGCANDFKSMIANVKKDIELKTIFIHDIPHRPKNIQELNQANVVEWIWMQCQNDLTSADFIVTSDTAPLARVLWLHRQDIKAKVIVWVCNRVDYFSPQPNPYFQQVTQANELQSMSQHFSQYAQTPYEMIYAGPRQKIQWNGIIRPMGTLPSEEFVSRPTRKSVFIGAQHNDAIAINLREIVKPWIEQAGLTIAEPTRYINPVDLSEYQAVIHVPYAASNLALFEALSHGIPQLLPSVKFLETLAHKKVPGIRYKDNFFLPGPIHDIHHIEWYQPEFQSCFLQFDRWEDIPSLLNSEKLMEHRNKIQRIAKGHKERTLEQWKLIFA